MNTNVVDKRLNDIDQSKLKANILINYSEESVIKPTKLEFSDSLKKMQQVFSNKNNYESILDSCSNIGEKKDVDVKEDMQFIQMSKNLQGTYLKNYNLSNINNSVEEDIEKVILDSSSKSKKIKTKLQIQEDDKSSLNNNQLETTILPD